MHAPSPSLNARRAMHGGNKLQIGLFGANCSSGRAVTLVPERWSGSWPDNKKLALMADQAGIDFLLPIGRWKGYGGTTDYQGTTLETVTWATALLAATKRITVFGTVHAPIFNPVVAAKEMVTAGEGRFGLNIVVGWNEGEFDMFGVEQRAHEQLRIRTGMDRRHQNDLVRSRGFRLPRQISQYERHSRQAETLWRHPPGDHECRRICDGTSVRCEELRRVFPTGLTHLARGKRATRSPRQRGRARKAAKLVVTQSALSPAHRPKRKRKIIFIIASSSSPTGRPWTVSWR